MKLQTRSRIDKIFLSVYIIVLILWIAEEIYTLTNPPEIYDRARLLIAILEISVAALSFFVIVNLYLELRSVGQEVHMARELIHDLKAQNKLLKGQESSFWNSLENQLDQWKLSDAEKEISVFLLRGFSNRQIAAVREKSLRTIENQTFSVYQKSGMRGKVEFISYFISPLLPEE
ncbi:MAG: response regulator [Leptospira sp.]|nr:response regulator [Leptospira sp.]